MEFLESDVAFYLGILILNCVLGVLGTFTAHDTWGTPGKIAGYYNTICALLLLIVLLILYLPGEPDVFLRAGWEARFYVLMGFVLTAVVVSFRPYELRPSFRLALAGVTTLYLLGLLGYFFSGDWSQLPSFEKGEPSKRLYLVTGIFLYVYFIVSSEKVWRYRGSS